MIDHKLPKHTEPSYLIHDNYGHPYLVTFPNKTTAEIYQLPKRIDAPQKGRLYQIGQKI